MSTWHSYFRWAALSFVLAALFASKILQAGEPGAAAVTEPGKSQGISTRMTPAMQFYTVKHNMTAFKLSPQTQGLATRLGMSLIKAGGEPEGPLHILFEIKQELTGQKQELLLAFPSRGNPRSGGRYRTIRTPSFHCSYIAYEGPAIGIADAWIELIKSTQDAGYKTNGQARYVFSCNGECSADHTSVELQLGIK